MRQLQARLLPITTFNSGGRKGCYRRCKVFLVIGIPRILVVTALLSLPGRPGPGPPRHPHEGIGASKAEYFSWNTPSSFNPVSQKVGETSMERLCRSFPHDVLESLVQPVLHISHAGALDKIEAQLESVSACLRDLLIFSDSDEDIDGRETIDVLQGLPAAYRFANQDLSNYTYLRGLQPGPTTTSSTLDKYKFLPMVERAWMMRPGERWCLFYEADTYVVWDTLLRFLDNLDHDTPPYIGCQKPDHHRAGREAITRIASSSSGVLLSRAAMVKLLHRKAGKHGRPVQREDVRGDGVLARALKHVGVTLSGFWPLFNPFPSHAVSFSEPYWCQPVMTPNQSRPEDMRALWEWEFGQRKSDRPLLYRDLYDFHHRERPFLLKGWDNMGDSDDDNRDGFGFRYGGPQVATFEACGRACDDDTACLQYRWHMGNCTFARSVRFGEARAPIVDARSEASITPPQNDDDDEPMDETYTQTRFMSGWSVPKIARWRDEHPCGDDVGWVKPRHPK
ncbi:hypothetical protein GGR56DRAFT_694051 [Xylariaceae sp. FL0804]|nr:hypothetical protein GGR56DRAFT_694051 [Xylariaceae sp. FL0804]